MAGLSLSGIASGVDTASIVDQLMALERQSLTKIGYRKAAVTGQQDALKEVASKLSTLKDAALALSADSTWAQKQTVESSDPARVAVTMLAGAGIGGQSISVDRLASSAQRRFNFAPEPRRQGKTTSAETLTLAYGRRRPARHVDDRRRGRLHQAADRRRHQRQDRRSRGRGRGQGARRRAARAVGAQDRQGLGLHGPATSAVVASTTTFDARSTGDDLQAAFRVGGGAQQLLGLERRRARDPRRPAHAQGRDPAPATVTVTEPALDRDAIKGKVKSFVDAYNAVVDTTRSKLTEQGPRTRRATSRPPAASCTATPG